MDFANDNRDDHFKEYAARASAECLIAFLRDHVDPSTARGLLSKSAVTAARSASIEEEHGINTNEHVSFALDTADKRSVQILEDSPSYQLSTPQSERVYNLGRPDRPALRSTTPRCATTPPLALPDMTIDLCNEVKLILVHVPGGAFRMGSADFEGSPDEHPQHLITLSPFYIGETSVTQRQYESVMGTNPSTFRNAEFPVENVTWFDSVLFANELSRLIGLQPAYILTDSHDADCNVQWDSQSDGCRLPTEAEWEYACRAMTITRYWSGDQSPDLARIAWYYKNSDGSSHRVGDLEPNPWRLFDMHGNVNEWTWDWFDPHWYSVSSAHDPAGPLDGTTRVVRGGSWRDSHARLRAARRAGYEPAAKSADIGLRLVRTYRLP
jgi:formylglycine-generating enzyme required for sulfatase activity